ncbi:Protein of unknown function [Gryllus bimaculatus]|nr:Protein of unknown function [Gryllus bimaculatus]
MDQQKFSKEIHKIQLQEIKRCREI